MSKHTNDGIVKEQTLEAIEDATQADGQEFLVMSYDLPTENTSWDDLDDQEQEELAKELKSIRLKLQQQFALKGVQLSQSTYIVRAAHVSTLVSSVDERYAMLDYDISTRIRDRVELHIVGSSYEHVVKDILKETLKEGVEGLANEMEVIESKAKNNSFEDESDVGRARRRLWDMSSLLDQLENRADDLCLIDEERGSYYRDKVQTLQDFRSQLLDRATFSGSSA